MIKPLLCVPNRYPYSSPECELLAIFRAFEQAASHSRERGGVARNVCIFVDNLVTACIKVPN